MKIPSWSSGWPRIPLGWMLPTAICDKVETLLREKGFCRMQEMERNEIAAFCNEDIIVSITQKNYDMDGKADIYIVVKDDSSNSDAIVAMLSALA
jgi:galactitol-specific phosphotransferase system IIB component